MPKSNVFSIATAYCGAVIGAGFATGREVVEFFTVYGRRGIWGVVVATVLFMWAGVIILDVTHNNPVYSYLDFLRSVLVHKPLIVLADILFLATLLAGTGVMTAAGGAILAGWGVNNTLGCAIFLVVCILILAWGSTGFIKANSWLVPGMALIIVALCLAQISRPALSVSAGPYGSALLYVAYNIAIAAVALSTLKEHLTDEVVLWSGLGGGLVLGVLLFLVYLATSGLPGQVEIPMGEIARLWLGKGQRIYELVLIIAVLTTALANMHGLACRVASQGRYWPVLILVAGMSLLISRHGFVSLVGLLYPLLGMCNIVLLAGLCYYSFMKSKAWYKDR